MEKIVSSPALWPICCPIVKAETGAQASPKMSGDIYQLCASLNNSFMSNAMLQTQANEAGGSNQGSQLQAVIPYLAVERVFLKDKYFLYSQHAQRVTSDSVVCAATLLPLGQPCMHPRAKGQDSRLPEIASMILVQMRLACISILKKGLLASISSLGHWFKLHFKVLPCSSQQNCKHLWRHLLKLVQWLCTWYGSSAEQS